MRKDIELHIKTGDVAIESHLKFHSRDFRWVTNASGLSRYIWGEIDIPAIVTEAAVRRDGFFFMIPYTPKYKELQIRVRRVFDDGSFEYVYNTKNGSEWFTVQAGMYGGERKNVYASQLLTISESYFYGMLDGDVLQLYSAAQSDFNIVPADRQNANCLLACSPSNNYRYPLSGVGIVRWVGSSTMNSGELAEVLKREFEEDGVVVRNAAYNYDTQQMETLDLDTSNV